MPSMPDRAGRYDTIIVGAGSAGCVLANRLSADPDRRVLVIEAGPRDKSPFIHIPAAASFVLGDRRYDWCFKTEPQPEMMGRRIDWPRGRTLGGSSSVNGMIHTRGHRADYDGWRASGLDGWGFADVDPYFRKAETRTAGETGHRGTAGPLRVSRSSGRNRLVNAFIDAGKEIGLPHVDDLNGETEEGIGLYDHTVHGGRRRSAAVAFLHPATRRPNLAVMTGVTVEKLWIEAGVVRGVMVARDGRSSTLEAARSVVLSAGTIGTPHLLMLSGIGPAAHLRARGLSVALDQPEVGANLRDHLLCALCFEGTRPELSLPNHRNPWNRARFGLQYLLSRTGPAARPPWKGGAFIRLASDSTAPDIQLFFTAAILSPPPGARPGYQIDVSPLRPRGRGVIRLNPKDPRAAPIIDPRYFSEPEDLEDYVSGFEVARSIAASPALAGLTKGEIVPGPSAPDRAALATHIRGTGYSGYHPVGTCRMGADATAPVDARLRFRGLDRLHVVDASVMPTLIGGNTNWPTIMIAEKAADMIIEDESGQARGAAA